MMAATTEEFYKLPQNDFPSSSSLSASNSYSHHIYTNDNTMYSANEAIAIHIDPRSHLEVSDLKHRYGKNLRYYFQEYCRIHNTDLNNISSSLHDVNKWKLFDEFFRWLDCSTPLPNVCHSSIYCLLYHT